MMKSTMTRSLVFILLVFSSSTVWSKEQKQPTPAENNLLKAYQKEYTFLSAQMRTLKKQLEELKQSREEKLSALKTEIKKLNRSWIRTSSSSKAVTSRLEVAERSLENVDFSKERVDNTLKQALHRLKEYDSTLPGFDQVEEKTEALKKLFTQAPLRLRELARPVWEKSEFFTVEGKKVSGEIVKYGNIAAFGFSLEVSGPVAPVKGGNFQLLNEIPDSVVAFKTNQLANVPFYFVESLSSEFTPANKKTVADEIAAGGTIGLVIIGLGILALIMAIFRFFALRSAGKSGLGLTNEVIRMLKKGEPDEALAKCKEGSCALSRVLTDTVSQIDKNRSYLEDIISESLIREGRRLERFATLILITAAVAPLLGLLGTVTGMISTFDVITEFGTGDPKMLSGGVSEALITTKFGLVVAIPAVLLGNLLSSWAAKIRSQIEQSALSVVNAVKG